MSTAAPTAPAIPPLTFAAPYIAGVVVQLPLLIRYLGDLAGRPHYGLYLIGLLAAIGVTLLRWPWGEPNLHRNTIKSILLAVLAVVAGVAGGVMVQPWFAALSALLLVASYLSAAVNQAGEHSLGFGVLPLLAFLRPPLNWDLSLNTWLQEISVYFASRFMHFTGPLLAHNTNESSFHFVQADGPYPFTDSLIGIGSIFTLIFAALIYIAVTRRGLFQSLLLVMLCLMWTVILNTVYLMLLPVSNFLLELEIVPGSVTYNALRVLLLLGTVLMIFSSGKFFRFAFSPVDPEVGRSYEFGRFITAFWNSFLAGEPFINETGQIVGRSPATITQQPPTMLLRWIMAGVLLVAGVLPLVLASPNTGTAFGVEPIELVADDLPEAFDDWALKSTEFISHQMNGSTVLGFNKSTWPYQTPDSHADLSISQHFGFWYDLTEYYAGQGWKIESKEVLDVAQEEPSAGLWSFVQTNMTQHWGENVLLLHCYFDANGNPVQPPTANGAIAQRIESAQQDAQSPLIQVSLYNSHYNDLDPDQISRLQNLFLEFRDAARTRLTQPRAAATVDADAQPAADSPTE